MTEIKKNKM